jgi:hypothetical protein
MDITLLRSYAREYLRAGTDTNLWSPTKLDLALQSLLSDFTLRTNKGITEVAATSTLGTLALPAGVSPERLLGVRLSTVTRGIVALQALSPMDFADQGKASGTPQYYTVVDSTISLYPTPTSNTGLVLRYVPLAPIWTVGATTPSNPSTVSWPDHLLKDLIIYVGMFAQAADPEFAFGQPYMARYLDFCNRMKGKY